MAKLGIRSSTWIIFICLGLMILPAMTAQAQLRSQQEIRGGFAAGFHLSSRGLALELELAKGNQVRQYLFGLSLNQVKDLREARIESFYGDQARSYVYGKLNHFVILQPTVGIQYNLLPKSGLNFVDVTGGVKIGPSIGFLNPYFLEIYLPGTPSSSRNKEIVPFNPAEHTYGRIYGRANMLSSRLELRSLVGLGIKSFVLINLNRNPRNISALKLGGSLDVYPNLVPILHERDGLQNRRLFFSLSAGLLLGKRW